MNTREDAATFYGTMKTLSTHRAKLRSWARAAGLLALGCFLLVSMFVLQVVALEASDRLGVFPLYGFFAVNVLCGSFLVWRIHASLKSSSRQRWSSTHLTIGCTSSLRGLVGVISGLLSAPKAKRVSRTPTKGKAVLLIIKRQASEELGRKSQAASV